MTQRWREATEEHLGRLRKEAASAEAAVAAASAAVGQALGHMQPPPAVLEQATIAGIDLQHAREAWKQWAARPSGADLSTASGLRALADHLEYAHAPLANAVTVLSVAASRELARRDDRWAPVAADVAAWRADAGPVCEATKPVASIKQARAWLVDATSDLRNARLAPLAHHARGIWASLRQQSNVDLGAFRLPGTATQRRVVLDVSVDDTGRRPGGDEPGRNPRARAELFLPRATMPESPFRFLIIDDPVQAMDPAKVDGLARVLERAAADRQVMVFTHDNRLAGGDPGT